MAKFLETLLRLGAKKKYVGHLGPRRLWTDEMFEIELNPEEVAQVEAAFNRKKHNCTMDAAAELFPDKIKRHH